VTSPWDPLGRALLAYQEGQHDAEILVESDLFETEVVPVAAYYRPAEVDLPELEQHALKACCGRVLDVGAGAGRHALELQATGLAVTALDISPAASAVMRARGVHRVVAGDLWGFEGGSFDTVLTLMNGLGVVGDLAGLQRWLEKLHDVVGPGGSILCDSSDLAAAFETDDPDACQPRTAQLQRGEVRFRLRFRECRGGWYRWLFCPEEELRTVALRTGWTTEILRRSDRAAFLARLRSTDRVIL
jgi:SAM-dependent methyltransferase